jgi:hypothetical protein
MELDFAHVCDYAYVGDGGKLYMLGEFRYIRSRQLPTRKRRIFVAFRILAERVEVREGKAPIQIEMTDQDGTALLPRSPEIQIVFSPVGPASPGRSLCQVVMELDQIELPRYGDYSIHIFSRGVHLGRATFGVAQPVAPPTPPAAPPPLAPGMNG